MVKHCVNIGSPEFKIFGRIYYKDNPEYLK